jgi:hypothetical protein
MTVRTTNLQIPLTPHNFSLKVLMMPAVVLEEATPRSNSN